MKCIPGECPHCIDWGFGGKVRCERNRIPPQHDGRTEDNLLGSGWFSTTLGASCLCKPTMVQEALF